MTLTPSDRAQIRRALVSGFRNKAKPRPIKKAVERYVGAIDADGTDEALREAHVNFERKAAGAPFPVVASVAEIAESFGLKPRAPT